jgi:hypothetical protein
MACYYYIKLPGGGEVRFSATFSPIVEGTDEYKTLQDEVEKYYSLGEVEVNKNSKLVNVLKTLGIPLNTNKIISLIKNSSTISFIENLNNSLIELGGESDLNSAI